MSEKFTRNLAEALKEVLDILYANDDVIDLSDPQIKWAESLIEDAEEEGII